MVRYQVNLAYDGTNFFGSQRQGKGRTVLGEIEKALRLLNWQGRPVLLAGRTDSGVHASGQVIAFDLDWKHGVDALGRALNAKLPADISVWQVKEAAPEFHPRFDAISRTYRYQVYCQETRDPFKERYAWRVYPPVDLEVLQEAAKRIPGRHDYSAFGAPMKPGASTVRSVYKAEWILDGGSLWFEIQANAFLYHMVRRTVYLNVAVGQKRLSIADLTDAVENARAQIPGLAPPQGLVLEHVEYAESKMTDS
jgi:tRNA pseudouridine38-40 synthase